MQYWWLSALVPVYTCFKPVKVCSLFAAVVVYTGLYLTDSHFTVVVYFLATVVVYTGLNPTDAHFTVVVYTPCSSSCLTFLPQWFTVVVYTLYSNVLVNMTLCSNVLVNMTICPCALNLKSGSLPQGLSTSFTLVGGSLRV